MHLFGTLSIFVLALALLAYIPGRLALRVARITVAPLDGMVLSLILGIAVSATVYWVLAYFSHQQWFFPLAIASTGIYALSRPKGGTRPPLSINRAQGLLLCTILIGGLLLALSPLYYSNMTLIEDGRLKVSPLFDAPLHAAIAEELTHTVPPNNPIFSGRPLSYHVGADLPAALFAYVTGLDVADLTLRFFPTFYFILGVLSVFCFSRLWFLSDYAAAFASFLVIFGEDFSFIPGWLQGSTSDWSVSYFGVPSVISLFALNPMLPGLGLLFAGFYSLLQSLRERQLRWQLIAGCLFGALAACKIFTAVHLEISLGVASIVFLLTTRRPLMLQRAIIVGMFMLPVLATTIMLNRDGASISVRYFQSFRLHDMVEKLGLTTPLNSTWPPMSFVIALTIFLVGSFGWRVIGLPAIIRELWSPRAEAPFRLVLAIFVVTGVFLGLIVTLAPSGVPEGYDNGVWFYVQSKYVAWLFSVEVILATFRTRILSLGRRTVIAALILMLAVPSTIQHFAKFNSAWKTMFLSASAVEVVSYLKTAGHPGSVVLAPEELMGPIVTMTKCHLPEGPYANYLVPTEDFRRRAADLNTFWTAWHTGQARVDLLQSHGVNFLVIRKDQASLPGENAVLVKIFANPEWLIYKVS